MNTANLTREEARQRAALISAVTYDVGLDVADGDTESFGSVTRVQFDMADPEATTFLDFVAQRIDRVVINGQELSGDVLAAAQSQGRLHLTDLGDHNDIEVHGRCSYSRAGVGLHRFTDPVDQEVFLYTQFEPFEAHRVFACFDQPDLKAPFTLAVTAPPGWQVVSNGVVDTRPPKDQGGRWTFETTPPIPTYITAVVAGPYHHVAGRHDGIDLGLYCRKSLADHLDADELFELTRQGLDWFATTFDYPYPFDKYDQLFVPEFNFGAMENPGCVTFSESYIFRSRVTEAARLSRANTILHEMAHMWFGDLVTMQWWDDLWLNESFATFIAHTAVARATRFGEDSWSDFAHSEKAWAYQQDQLPSTHPIVADMVDTQSVMANFDGITYAKGASVLKQLHAWVGEEAFFEGLRGYFPAHEWGNANLQDFLRVLEKPSGRDLQPWAAKWLQTAGVATLSATIQTDETDLMSTVTIHQDVSKAYATQRPHRLRIGSYVEGPEGLVRTDLVELDIDGSSTVVESLAGKPRPDLLLVNDDDLSYAKVRLDDRSVQTLERSLGSLEGGVARAVCWGSLWDATRDAELAARRFADLVATHGPGESDISVLQTLLRQALVCADRYGSPDNRQAVRQRLADLAQDQLNQAAPGSDLQLVWVRALISTRTKPAFTQGLVDGSQEIEGLAVDADLRWFALGNLTAMGEVGEDAITAELERDPTDIGRRGAETARASRPEPTAKEQAWQRALDTSAALHTRVAGLQGFWQVEQRELLMPYAEQGWVEPLPDVWRSASTEEALTLTKSLYPHELVDERVVAAADRALSLDLPPVAKRSLGESRDATLRALRAQKADRAVEG
ncbi:aminopeptidase N [soil metagenome]